MSSESHLSGSLPQDVDRLPLSPLQESILATHRLLAVRDLYVEQFIQVLPERLDPTRFRNAWQQVWTCHPALRSGFSWDEQGVPFQWTMTAEPGLPVQQIDLSREGENAELCWQELLVKDRKTGFDLANPPSARLLIARLGEKDWRACWTVHHILVDGRSMSLVLQQVFAIYDDSEIAFRTDDFFRHHLATLADLKRTESTVARDYWRESLGGMTSLGSFPFEIADTHSETSRTNTLTRNLPAELSARLPLAADALGVTVNTLVQAAWGWSLGLFFGTRDVVFGILRAGRHPDLSEARDGVGMFLQTEPIRISGLDQDVLLGEWLVKVRSSYVSARQHGWVGSGQIAAWLGKSRDEPLLGSLLAFERERLPDEIERTCGGPRGRRFELRERADFPLILSAWERQPMGLSLAFDASRYPKWAMEELLQSVEHLLSEFAGDPARRLRQIPLLTTERHLARQAWNNTTVRDTESPLLHAGFEAIVKQDPTRPCLIDGQITWTYGDLEAAANQLAHRLIELGVGPETRVALRLRKSVRLPMAILGILKAGGAYLPIDQNAPPQATERMLAKSGAQLLIVDESLPPGLNSLPGCPWLALECEATSLAEYRTHPPAVKISGKNLAYAIFTSGTTGIPKLVGVEHRSAANVVCYARKELFEPADLAQVPFIDNVAFDSSVSQLFVTWALGGALVFHHDLAMVVREENGNHPTSIGTVPSGLLALLDAGELPPSVRVIGLGGETIPASLLERLVRLGNVRKAFNYYGPTETTIYSMVARLLGPGSPQRSPLEDRGRNLGYPIHNTQIHLLDRFQRPVPFGAPGEIYIGGLGITRGYLDAPELTAERFLPDPWSTDPEARLYRTGDLGYQLPDGSVEFLGREDQQVKLRGHRVELGAIETELIRHPSLQDAVVIAREDVPGIQHLVAYLIPSPSQSVPSDAEIRAFLEPRLPDFMIPVACAVISHRPLTTNGKLDRQALPAISFANSGQRIASSSDLERKLCAIWTEVLGHSDFGVTDNFFAIGGHSLSAIKLVLRIEHTIKEAGHLPVTQVFRTPTVRGMATLITEGNRPPQYESLIPMQPLGKGPVLFFIHGVSGGVTIHMDVARLLAPSIQVYGLQAVEINDRHDPLITVDQMIGHYVREIRRLQPSGPYYLAGFCVGGCFAFETARRLKEEGAEIGTVFLEDARPVGRLPFVVRTRYLARKVPETLFRHAKKLLKMPPSQWPKYIQDRIPYRWRSVTNTEPQKEFVPENNRFVSAAKVHHFGRLDADVVLFLSDDFPDATITGWNAMAGGRVEVHRIHSGHQNFSIDAAPVTAAVIRKVMLRGTH